MRERGEVQRGGGGGNEGKTLGQVLCFYSPSTIASMVEKPYSAGVPSVVAVPK